jgi:hypothetical protein
MLTGGVSVALYGSIGWMDLPPPAPQIVLPANALMLVAFCVDALLCKLSQRLGRIGPRGSLPKIKIAVRISNLAGIKMTTRCRDITEAQVNSMNLSIKSIETFSYGVSPRC